MATKSKKGKITSADLQKLSATLPSRDDFIARDRRQCDCELTYVHRKDHGAIGTGIEIRLCCLAKFIEKEFGLPKGTFFYAMEFEPTWEWDCQKVWRRKLRDGSIEEGILGPPPRWIQKRMDKKGIEVKNLPKGRKGKA